MNVPAEFEGYVVRLTVARILQDDHAWRAQNAKRINTVRLDDQLLLPATSSDDLPSAETLSRRLDF
jgi:hypothetical protein